MQHTGPVSASIQAPRKRETGGSGADRQSISDRELGASLNPQNADGRLHVFRCLGTSVQALERIQASDDAAERGEAGAVGISSSAFVEFGLVADADEESVPATSRSTPRQRERTVAVPQSA